MTGQPHFIRRPGLLGIWDTIVGPGADPVEIGLIVGALIAGPGLAVAWAWATGADWSWWRWPVVALVASELAGGLAAGAAPAGKRWRHRAGQGPRQLFTYAALHIHPLLLALVLPGDISMRSGMVVYGLLLASAGACIIAPPRLKGATGLFCTCGAIVVCSIWLPLLTPLGWLPAVLFLKVIAADLMPPAECAHIEPPLPHGPWS